MLKIKVNCDVGYIFSGSILKTLSVILLFTLFSILLYSKEVSSVAFSDKREYELALKLKKSSRVQDQQKAFNIFMQYAKQDNPDAEYELGTMYYKGIGTGKNYEKALEWYKKAAAQGSCNANNMLGACYFEGFVVEQNYTEAYAYYKKAADAGHADAARSIGWLYLDGLGVKKNYSEALKWFQKAADAGNANAYSNIGFIYYCGSGREKDLKKAFKYYMISAEKGVVAAKYQVGYMLQYGKGVPKNINEALKWYKKAALQGDISSQIKLSKIYYSGDDVPKDETLSLKWLQMAVDQHSPEAEYILGIKYLHGWGCEKNIGKALEWTRKAAVSGYVKAEYLLGRLFFYGTDVEQDFAESLKWLKITGDDGEKEAYELVGVIYFFGKGVPADQKKALEYIIKSEDDDPGRGEYRLGIIFYYGFYGVEEDHEQALKWFKKAAGHGSSSAYYKLGNIYAYGEGVEESEEKAYGYYLKAAELDHVEALKEVLLRNFSGNGTAVNMDNVILYGNRYVELKEENSVESKSFVRKLQNELIVYSIVCAYLLKGEDKSIIPVIRKLGFPFFIISIIIAVMSLPFSFLVGLLIYLKIRNRKKRVKAETWTLSDGFLSIFMFLVFSLLASIWIFIPLSIIPGQIKIIFLQITAGVMTLLLFLFLVVKRKWSIKERFSIKKIPARKLITWVLCSVLFIFLFDYCYDSVFSLLKIKKEQQFIVTIIPDKSMGILTKLFFISAVGFVIPLLEEIIFRGIFYQGLKSRLPVTVAILLSSSVFALFHLQPEALIPIFVLSMIITYSYEKTESILTPIAIHSLNNFIGIVIIIFFK